jgi:hypothetical protein
MFVVSRRYAMPWGRADPGGNRVAEMHREPGGRLTEPPLQTPIRSPRMHRLLVFVSTAFVAISMSANAQTPLTAYADKDGWLDVQALTCAELAGTFQEDADMLTTWYSGWYNGLAKKHYINIPRAKEAEHEVIIYCKAHKDKKIIDAIGLVIDEYRKKHGIELSK